VQGTRTGFISHTDNDTTQTGPCTELLFCNYSNIPINALGGLSITTISDIEIRINYKSGHEVCKEFQSPSLPEQNKLIDNISTNNASKGTKLEEMSTKATNTIQTFHTKVHPNPFRDQLNIKVYSEEGRKPINLLLIDVLGKIVRQEQYEENDIILDTKQLPVGMYQLLIQDTNGNYDVHKIIKH